MVGGAVPNSSTRRSTRYCPENTVGIRRGEFQKSRKQSAFEHSARWAFNHDLPFVYIRIIDEADRESVDRVLHELYRDESGRSPRRSGTFPTFQLISQEDSAVVVVRHCTAAAHISTRDAAHTSRIALPLRDSQSLTPSRTNDNE